jgi:hypothetical protein
VVWFNTVIVDCIWLALASVVLGGLAAWLVRRQFKLRLWLTLLLGILAVSALALASARLAIPLLDDRAWARATAADDADAYENYMETWLYGKHVEDAQNALSRRVEFRFACRLSVPSTRRPFEAGGVYDVAPGLVSESNATFGSPQSGGGRTNGNLAELSFDGVQIELAGQSRLPSFFSWDAIYKLNTKSFGVIYCTSHNFGLGSEPEWTCEGSLAGHNAIRRLLRQKRGSTAPSR